MMGLSGLNALRGWIRVPLKWLIIGVTALLVCFPYPNRFLRHVRHLQNPNHLIEPDHPGLGPWLEELRSNLGEDLPAAEALKTVEKFVYAKIPYGWDWDVWGMADYFPTLSEVLDKGKEDCDGRAVVAASLLQRLGYKSEIVTDFAHVWVKTDRGETMSPGKKPVIVAGEQGVKVVESVWRPLLKSTAYGVAVFPLHRELIILTVAWVLLRKPAGHRWTWFLGLWLLVAGLVLLRAGSANFLKPMLEAQLFGCGTIILAVALLYFGQSPPAAPSMNNETATRV